jgi:hypothetical protein
MDEAEVRTVLLEGTEALARATRNAVLYANALREIIDEMERCLATDQNPHRGMLMRAERIAATALKEAK